MALPPLYKYLDVDGAKLTLGNRTFKHAKPSDFNDTEDLTIKSIFPEEMDHALSTLERQFPYVILKNVDVIPTCSSPNKESVMLIQAAIRANPKAAEAIIADLTKPGRKPVYDRNYWQLRAQEQITEINELMQSYRILCVTTHKNSERMWADYAQSHKGIAVRIEPCVAKDSKFQLFRPVVYRDRRPPLYEDTLGFITEALFGDHVARSNEMVERIVFTKTLEWQHESEYRLAIPILEGQAAWNTRPFLPEEITELLIGLEQDEADTEVITHMARQINPRIAVLKAERSKGELQFKRLG